MALRSANSLFIMANRISQHHRLLAVFYKTEALLNLDRLSEAVEHFQLAVEVQSEPRSMSANIYNRVLLEAISGNLQRALEYLQQVSYCLMV